MIQGTLEDGEEPKAHKTSSNARCNSWNALTGRPTEKEKPSGKNHRTNHRGWYSSFGNGFIVIGDDSVIIKMLV